MRINYLLIVGFLLLRFVIVEVMAQSSCIAEQAIKAIKLPGVTITELQEISSGDFILPGGKMVKGLPVILRVVFIAKPTAASYIRNEIWMPKDTWNGRFLGTGNGGGAGSISYNALISGVKRGFATANTDMGTSGGLIKAVGCPDIWADFGYRATHEMTIIAKEIIQIYYKRSNFRSYFVGCSTGGQQALMEAQRFPDDYEGIIVGAPANNRTHLHASFIWNLKANNQLTGEPVISKRKMELLSGFILRDCVGKDGGALTDDFLTDPQMCKFDLRSLPKCPNGNVTDSCFSQAEIDALVKIYSGPINPKTKEIIYTPLPFGGTYLEPAMPHLYPFNWVFGEGYDYSKFDFDRDMGKVDSLLGPVLNANNPDLRPFKKRGGKMLMYTGTSDMLVVYHDALNYYERVIKSQHGLRQTQVFFRFFLVPGMGHCGSGPGLNEFGQGLSLNVTQDGDHDILTAVINWVEKGIAPDKIIAKTFNCCDTINEIGFQRPIYPYPKFPHYIGGNPNLPSSFKGLTHKRGGVLKSGKEYL
jgi:feruloyl esterase